MTYKTIRKTHMIDDIPVLVTIPEGIENPTTIIHYHGWGSTVENQLLLGDIFGSQGYRVIMPEIVDHGKRGSVSYDSFEGTAKVVRQSMDEYPELVEELKSLYNIDKLYVSGHSLGGTIVSLISNVEDVDGIIIYNSFYLIRKMIEELATSFDIRKYFSPEDIDIYEEIMDIPTVDRLAEIDYIINVGLQDNVIDPKLMGDLHYELAMRDISGGEFFFYDDQGHGIGYKMIRDTIKHLKGEIND